MCVQACVWEFEYIYSTLGHLCVFMCEHSSECAQVFYPQRPLNRAGHERHNTLSTVLLFPHTWTHTVGNPVYRPSVRSEPRPTLTPTLLQCVTGSLLRHQALETSPQREFLLRKPSIPPTPSPRFVTSCVGPEELSEGLLQMQGPWTRLYQHGLYPTQHRLGMRTMILRPN